MRGVFQAQAESYQRITCATPSPRHWPASATG